TCRRNFRRRFAGRDTPGTRDLKSEISDHKAIMGRGISHCGSGRFWPIKGGSSTMPVQLICPNLRCRKFLVVPEDVRGKLVKCQHCQTAFRVPEPTKKPVDSAAAAK